MSLGSVRTRYCTARPFAAFLGSARTNAEPWQTLTRRAHVPAATIDRVRTLGGRWHLLVLAEDWCGDAVNSLPVLAKLAEQADNLDLRVLSRDANPDLMDAHRSPRGARAMPVVMVLDAEFVERGWWGSRPSELQRWVEDVGRGLPTQERYREVRRWYARDRGTAVLDEIIAILECAARERLAA